MVVGQSNNSINGSTSGVAPGYVEYGLWPTCGHALSENRRLTTLDQISTLISLRSPQDMEVSRE